MMQFYYEDYMYNVYMDYTIMKCLHFTSWKLLTTFVHDPLDSIESYKLTYILIPVSLDTLPCT
jgi:hypothetical protein